MPYLWKDGQHHRVGHIDRDQLRHIGGEEIENPEYRKLPGLERGHIYSNQCPNPGSGLRVQVFTRMTPESDNPRFVVLVEVACITEPVLVETVLDLLEWLRHYAPVLQTYA